MPDLSKIFDKYEILVAGVDKIFRSVQEAHPDCMRCRIHCADCCHAVFDLTLVEAAYMNHQFMRRFNEKDREPILTRAETVDRQYYKIKRKLQKMHVDEGRSPEEVLLALSQERVRCPLLNEEDLCDLYASRPITCRVYGIPTSIGGQPHICEHANFQEGTAYPTINLDKMNDRLFALSKELLEDVGSTKQQMQMSLVPPSVALITEYDDQYFGIE